MWVVKPAQETHSRYYSLVFINIILNIWYQVYFIRAEVLKWYGIFSCFIFKCLFVIAGNAVGFFINFKLFLVVISFIGLLLRTHYSHLISFFQKRRQQREKILPAFPFSACFLRWVYKSRGYWLISRGLGFLAVVWFGSSPTPILEDWERETTFWKMGGRRWERSQIIRR